jgi:hypothetical protein
MHFTSTLASWSNQVVHFIRPDHRGPHPLRRVKSIAQLEAAIQQYLENHNADAKPFTWTAFATTILEKVARGRQALESAH